MEMTTIHGPYWSQDDGWIFHIEEPAELERLAEESCRKENLSLDWMTQEYEP